MNLKDTFNRFFSYLPENNYEFTISENAHEGIGKNINNQDIKKDEKVNIFPSLYVNVEYIKTKYNILINSDVILREFTMHAYGKQYNAFLIYIDGMVDSKIMDDFILKPLMLRNKNNLYSNKNENKIISEYITSNNVTIRKIKKFDLANYLMNCLIPQNTVKLISTFDEVTSGVNSRKLCIIY